MKNFSRPCCRIFFFLTALLFSALFLTTSLIEGAGLRVEYARENLFQIFGKTSVFFNVDSAKICKVSAKESNDSLLDKSGKNTDFESVTKNIHYVKNSKKSVSESLLGSSAKTTSESSAETTSESSAETTSESSAKTTSESSAETTSESSTETTSESSAKTASEGIRSSVIEKDLVRREQDLSQDWERKLQLLLKKCDEYKMPLEKEISRRFLVRTKENGFIVAKIPKNPFLEQLPEDASVFQNSWHKALRRLRKETAEGVYQLGEICLAKKEGFEAFRLFRQALSIDSDHQGARQRFGYVLIDGQWLSPYEQNQRVKGLVEHEKFGWLDKDDLARYEKGERRINDRWYSIEEEIKVRRRRHLGWRAETDHYQLMTEHSLEEGVRIIRILENYYQAWLSLFYRFTASEKQWNSALEKNHLPGGRKHKVFLFADREAYLREVRKMDSTGQIEMSHGGYFPEVRCIYVYLPGPGEKVDLETMLVHEATHQLFEECRNELDTNARARQRKRSPIIQNFWILEGSATYMETFRDDGMNYHIGGLDSPRFLRAKERVFEPNGTLPLRQYAQLSARAFQSHKDLPMLYTQAAGLTLFFLHYENGKYRNVFINYLFMVYERVDQVNTLEILTGKSFEELDQEYQSFMKNLKTEKSSDL